MSSDVAPVSALLFTRLLRIVVSVDMRTSLFELGPSDLRAIVVGEVPGADVRVAGDYVPEIAFHLERDGDAVLLVPAYARDLQVDGVKVSSVCVLPWRSRISFSGVHLTISISDHPARTLKSPAAG
jgi:hypothetical protein